MTHSASYPEEFCLPVNSMKLIWFQYFQTDESCKSNVPLPVAFTNYVKFFTAVLQWVKWLLVL